MKARQWSRLYRSTYGKPRAWSYNFLAFYCMTYIIYLLLQVEYFDKAVRSVPCSSFLFLLFPRGRVFLTSPQNASGHTLEYLLMGVLSVAVGYISPTFSWFIRVLLFELYGAIYIFFLLDLSLRPDLYVALGCSVGGILFLTVVNWMFYPIMQRFVVLFFWTSLNTEGHGTRALDRCHRRYS